MNAPARTIVHLMRHGEVHNPEGVLYGRLPGYQLSELGREMADTVAAHLADHDIGLVVASPLDRAQQTATPIARSHDLEVATDSRVIEAGNHFEGLTFGRGAGSLRKVQNLRRLYNPVQPSWGEPYKAIAARMFAAVDDARDGAWGREAVVVSHQLPIWTVRSKLEGRRLWHDPRKRECTLASLTSLMFEDDELQSVTYSEPAAHLLARASTAVGA
jgi:broad specificity phosphatase PhoE